MLNAQGDFLRNGHLFILTAHRAIFSYLLSVSD